MSTPTRVTAPMTDERLAEIREVYENLYRPGPIMAMLGECVREIERSRQVEAKCICVLETGDYESLRRACPVHRLAR